MIASSTIMIEHKIFDFEKGTTNVAVLKLWLVYCVSSMQMYFLSTRQIFQSKLKVESNKSSSTFCNKSNHVVLLMTVIK